MKWILTLALAAWAASSAYCKERLAFPFDQTSRITFIRLGTVEADAGQQFVLENKTGQWVIQRRISRYNSISEDITDERAHEMLAAFSDLYTHWQNAPYRDTRKNGYSLFISINETWQIALRVKDRGSPELNRLLELIEYPDGLVLEEEKEDELPNEIRAASDGEPEDTEDGIDATE